MQQLLPVAIRSILEKPARYMKVLKGYVQNRTRPEGCIAKRYIAEEALEFALSIYLMLVELECLQARRWEFRSYYQVAQIWRKSYLISKREQNGCKISTITLSFNGSTLRFKVNLMGKSIIAYQKI
ncbi:hypothetical protein L3X38_017428 [Prunus dulcis]|uniref:DUF4218 domain-containing protein n=1 Tax=Prunus dulcis TaxID=3755 RepID=A0AAD4W943_PRUDU|nr:hypothetical protein L3X38_017428 [Prunus dulcis]